MKDEYKFSDGRQIDVREKGDAEYFYGQHIVAVSVKPDVPEQICIVHYTSLHGSSGMGIPVPVGFQIPLSMAREVAEALLKLADGIDEP